MASTLRHLFGNPGGIAPHGASWPLAHPVLYAVLWTAGIIAVAAPAAVVLYQRSIRS